MISEKITGELDTNFKPDSGKYISDLKDMISCRTVSEKKYYDKNEFDRFDTVLQKNFPRIMSVSRRIEAGGSTFLKIPGKEENRPLVLMSHKDVVHEGEKPWKAPPYEGRIIKGKIYGRGTFDTKGSLCSIFEAVESLLAEGYEFGSDLYIFASSTEEIAGGDAPAAVEYFRNSGITPGLVIDEGGAVLRNPFPSKIKRFAMIGAVERSSGNLLVDAGSEKKRNELIKTLKKLRIGKYGIYPEVSALIDGLADYLMFPLKLPLRFLGRHHRLAASVLTHCGRDARSFCGALASGRLPEDEENCRDASYPLKVYFSGNYYNKIDRLADELKKFLAKNGVTVLGENLRETEEPTPLHSDGFRFVSKTAEMKFDRLKALPYPVLGRTDARYFIGAAENVIRFIPVEINLIQMMLFHNPNENIYADSLTGAVGFYREIIKQYMKNEVNAND
ncbi:MAG: M20/M25/M40 family metallo-hydrolase [Clostridia bacterium]|nr:M20/M25/M40 family metallo-hydrolase [Clostridia bacterium]